MEIISLQFAAFVVIVVSIYHLLPFSLKKSWLLVVSIIFYFLIDLRYLFVLALLVFMNYWFAYRFFHSSQTKKFTNFALLLNISSFGLLKILTSRYPSQFFGGSEIFQSGWLLPVGFSFYVLQLISFQLDIRNKRITDLPSLLDFALFLLYFPKLLSGPIEKPKLFLKQLDSPKVVDNATISHGAGLIFLGVFRKIVIANLLSFYMPNWTKDIYIVGWSHVFGYVILLYNDFAGYTSVVRGVSYLLGIELSPNFQQPFLSQNFSEFWNRWHISLSTWLRENIYFPLSRKLSRNSGSFFAVTSAIVIPPMITMLASGFWHGASLAMLLWGSLQGVLLILERLLYNRWSNLRPQFLPPMGKIISGSIVFFLFSLTMVPFAVNSVKPTLVIWDRLLLKTGFTNNQAVIPVLVLGGLSFLMDALSQKKGNELWWDELNMIPRAAVIVLGILILVIAITINTATPGNVFIYQTF